MVTASIIITTYNRSSMVKRAIESALKSGNCIEVIVVDDASTDDTPEVCKTIHGIKYIRNEQNLKTAGARNVGLLASTAPYVGFLDDDDLRLPSSVDKQVDLLKNNPDFGLVYGKFLFADQSGNLLNAEPFPYTCPQGDVFWKLLGENVVGCLTAIFRRDCLSKVGLLDIDPNMYGIEDYDLWIRIAEVYPFGCLEEPVAVYRKPEGDSDQWSSNSIRQQGLVLKAARNKWLKLPRTLNTPEAKEFMERYLSTFSDKLLYDLCTNTGGSWNRLTKLMQIARFNPTLLRRPLFYKAAVKSFLREE